MNQRELDEAVAKVQSEQVSDEVVKAAAGRVFSKLFDSAFVTAEPTGKIRGCADVRALIPAYLNRTISTARALLLEDHILTCVDCRRALQEARSGAPTVRLISINRAPRKHVPMLVWAAAAALLVGIGLGFTGLLPGQNSMRATVASVQGTLYKVTDIGVSLVEAGAILKNTDELRTAKGSHAILRLAGGAMVEIAERSDVSLSGGGWRTASLNLERGQMIVDARNADQKSFNVTSGEMTIPVTNSVVAVDHGTKESRVAVAKGNIDVHMGPVVHPVAAGHQFGGAELRNANFTVASEFAWSQNSASYLDLLNQLSGLQKDIQSIPSPSLRYSSNLPQYLPADTFLYAAIPNLGGTITEAKKLFDNRLAESEVLRQWWQQKDIAKNGQFDHIVDQISSISGYIGNEIVVAVGGEVAGSQAGPVFIAEITKPGLAEYLQSNLPTNYGIEIVTAGLPVNASNKLLIEMDNNILVATPSAIQLRRVEDVVQKLATGNFTSTPFYARINKVYQNGAGTFLAANLEQIGVKSVSKSKVTVPVGLENVQYLVLERKDGSELRASVSFDGDRHGVASWLGAPSPAGSLNFVSPDANFAASMVMKNPRVMMQELLGMASNANPDFTKELDNFQAKAGVSLLDDVAAPLGNDVTLAMDGALTPILAVEVYDPNHLQATLKAFIGRFNEQAPTQAGRLILGQETANGRTYFSIANSKSPTLAAYYTFVDGYLLASSSTANVTTAIQNKQTGHTLASSDAFRGKLPDDGYANYSALVYSNLGALGDLAKQLKGSEKQKMISGLIANGGPGLVCVYGETDRIVAAAKGSFLGFDLGTLVGLQEGKPLKNMIAGVPGGATKGILN